MGLTPTSLRLISASGWRAPATSQKAAALKSPGTRRLSGVRSWLSGDRRRAFPSSLRSAPIARSIRSVWSRDRAGSSSVVSPSAWSPASRSADFTWALATGERWWMPRSGPPCIVSGARLSPSRPRMSAPISRRGRITRPIGRLRSDSSPVIIEKKGRPARSPASNRIVVPELRASSTPALSRNPPSPRPLSDSRALSSPLRSRDQETPRARRQSRVARQSSAGRKFSTVAGPAATALRMAARWEIDLSPGTMTAPRSLRGGLILRGGWLISCGRDLRFACLSAGSPVPAPSSSPWRGGRPNLPSVGRLC